MKRITYLVDLAFANAPRVVALYEVTDAITGQIANVQLTFAIESGSLEIVPMIPNPAPSADPNKGPGEDLIVDRNAPIDLARLDQLASARLAEATNAPATVLGRLQAAEAARQQQVRAEAAAQAAEERLRLLEEEIAVLEAEKAAATIAVE